MCSAPAFYAWRRLPLICLKLLVGVCVRDGLAASVCVRRTSATSVELLPRGWRVIMFPRWLHVDVQSCSTTITWLTLIVRCCFGGLRVRDGLAASVCVCSISAASTELLPRGWRAVAFTRWLIFLSCSTWLIVRCCISGLCFGFIGANSTTAFHPPSCVLCLLKCCLCCPQGERVSVKNVITHIGTLNLTRTYICNLKHEKKGVQNQPAFWHLFDSVQALACPGVICAPPRNE